MVFRNASTLTEEDFDPSIGESDFGVKVESVEKSEKYLLRMPK
jgi:electron transfer flavoprotein alpha subunit